MHLTRDPARAAGDRAELVSRVGVVALAVVAAALADTAPTGHAAADVAWRCLIALAVTSAGLVGGPVVRIVPAVAVAAVAAPLEAWGVAAAACVVLVASALLPHRGRWGRTSSGAIVGASTALLFRLPSFEPARVTTLFGVVAGAVVLWAGWRNAAPSTRRALRWPVLGLGAAVVAMSGPFVVAGAIARADVNRGAGEAHAWRVQTTEGEDDVARGHLERAGLAFDEAADGLDGWWMAPARLVPVVAQHARAAETGVASGQRLVRSAEAILDVADPDDLQLTDGRLDLELVERVGVPVSSGADVLASVEDELGGLERDWLFPTIQHDVREVTRQVREARRDAAFASRALEVAPALLGGDTPRRYFVVFSTPSEARELGGILGNWGILSARDGRLELERTDRAGELNFMNEEQGVTLTDPGSYPRRFVRAEPDVFWQNVTSAVDLPTVARAVADMYGQGTGETLDGVLVVDPTALAALLELTGPVPVEGLDEPLAADTAEDFLLRDQYAELPELSEREDFLADAAEATFDRLTQGTLPGPAHIADVLGPAVDGRHLQLWTFDDAAHGLLEEVGLAGTLPPTDEQDVLAVARTNLEANKLDAYLAEDIRYEVEVDDATGEVRADLTLTYTSDVPSGLPDYVAANDEGLPRGTHRVLVSVWTPHRAVAASIDGDEVSLERQSELGRRRYLRIVEVPPEGTVTLRIRLEGVVESSEYRVTVVRAPRAVPGSHAVEVRKTDR